MLDTEIYAKTDAGREEIRSRALGLTMAARAILLMVDGQRNVSAMRTLIAGSKASPDVLDALLAQGLIEARTGASPTGASAGPSPSPAPVPPSSPVPPPMPQVVASSRPVAAAPAVEPHPAFEAAAVRGAVYDGPLDLVLPTIVGPEASDPASLVAGAPLQASAAEAAPTPGAPAHNRYEHLYGMMNEIVRDFLAPHRRFFFQLKIERCGSAEDLLELLHDLQAALSKARGEAFAADVISRLRNAAG